MADLGLGQELQKMSLKHLIVPVGKKGLKKKKENKEKDPLKLPKIPTMMAVCQRDTRVN